MTEGYEGPTADQAAVHADQPKSQFELGHVAVLLNEEVVNDKGNHCEVAILVRDKRYVDGGWEYIASRNDGNGGSVYQEVPERLLTKPRYAIGERIRVAGLPDRINAGTVMGYKVDGRNALHYDIQRDLVWGYADDFIKIDD